MKLELSEDNMQAFLIFQDEDLANPIDKAAIVKLLHEMDITEFNLNEGWQDAYEKFQQKVLEENQYLIAEGTPVIAGKDGWLEYFFETDVRHNLESDEHGQVDFHNLHFVQNVKKGDRLVELHAPTEGTPGKDLFANVVEVEEVKPASLPNCQNAEVSSENPNIIIAKIDGHVRLARSKEIVVEDVVKISGDIDFDTGDIKAIGSVIISGDVKSGFKVEAQGSITIKGCVEDATIISSADVIIKNGFIGHGKGVVHAGGDVITKHVSNQQIVADGKILVNGEIIQGHLLAGESIEAKGHAGNIIGGIIQAGTSVTAHCIGNTTNMRTDVTIGSNTQIRAMVSKQEEVIAKTRESLERVKQGITALVRVQINNGSLPQDKEKLLGELKKARVSLEAQEKDQVRYLDELNAQIEALAELAFIQCHDTIFPGVRLHYHTHNFPVRYEIKKETITPHNFYEFR